MPLDARGPCGYGVPREQCHVGCGRTCRVAYRRETRDEINRRAREALHRSDILLYGTDCCGQCDDAHTEHAPCDRMAADS